MIAGALWANHYLGPESGGDLGKCPTIQSGHDVCYGHNRLSFARHHYDIAQDVQARGEYTYLARRISKQKEMPAKDIPVTSSGWFAFDPNDPRMIGYDYCTPDYVMGSLIIDPTLPRVESWVGSDLEEGIRL